MTAARMLRFLWSPALVLALTALSSPGDAQCLTATVSIPGSTYKVLLDGDTLAVSYFGSPSMFESFRFQGGAWNPESSFPIGTNGAFTALEGDTLIFADQSADVAGLQYVGKVVVYERTAGVWNAVQELVPPVLDIDLHFGSAVALEGDTLVVGEAYSQSPRLGRAYVYERQGGSWILQAELPSPGPQRFGRALALQGDRLVVGADDGAFCYQGGGASWTQVQQIVPQPFEIDLGEAVRLDGSLLALSSRRMAPAPRRWGVSVFEQNAGLWTESGRIDSTNVELNPNGRPFVLAGGRLFVGFSSDDDAGLSAGTVFVFGATAGAWSLQDKLYTDNSYGGATGLGRDLAADAGLLAVAGNSVYVFALTDPACPQAVFSAVPLAGPAPLAVAFTDESAGVVTEWSWSFGDGGSASDQNPSHVYAWPGRYKVDLLARGPAGVSREIRRDLVFAGSTATARTRNGSGVNPARLANLSLPVIGSTWSSEIDASAHPGARLAILQGRERALAGRSTPWGELLVDPASAWIFSAALLPDASARARFDCPIPNDLALVGFDLSVQGGILDGRAELLNAIDLVIGF